MKLISINIGDVRGILQEERIFQTGIFKIPTDGPVEIGTLGISNDMICDKKNHGGRDQAVYVYGLADYHWWEAELGRPIAPGTFGENLTIRGLESASFLVGDCILIGQVTLQVTSPRIPCGTLSARMGDPSFKGRFRKAARPGLYCRVLKPGRVHTGDEVIRETFDGETVSIREMFQDHYSTDLTEETLRHYLAAPIKERDRIYYQKRLEILERSRP